MVYVTTRNPFETYTAYHALNENRSGDGGFYVPLQLPKMELGNMKEIPMNQAIAQVLNGLFPVQLTGRDIDLIIGKSPVRLVSMNHRITVVESWHNLDWDYARMVKNIAALIRGTRDTEQPYGHWAEIAVRIGVLFGAYSELLRQGLSDQEKFDVSVPSADCSALMSAWYAREMGLPIENILICCNENNNLWELINRGEMRTGRVAIQTTIPDCDRVVPELLEQLIFACGGAGEVERYLTCCREGRAYFPEPEVLEKLQRGIRATVVGQKRLHDTVPGAYGTHGYVFGPYSALTYAGLMDYRARTGENSHGLILSERGALLDDGFVAETMGISIEKLHTILD